MSESWPDHSSELARKTMEAVIKRADQQARGKITDAMMWLVLDTLSDVTQGLIPQDDWQLIYDAQRDLRKTMKAAK